ncbi:PQQ-binding-like beta-propeller repeat protein [Mycobacterium sp.]|uniref:outer membrane protein assembly factor BamB family protein n=1 Tax=Mycobacterium sp. TaxID=1785 RepID=UPI002D837731|nr:PQQ-binding-like beta-propeller repeat protein [Mycobacterium sp.]
MPEESPSIEPRPGRARRVSISLCVGAAIAAAVAAIIGPIVMWGVRSSSDYMSRSLTGMGVVAIVIGVCVVLTLVGSTLLRRYQAVRRLGVLAAFVAVGLGVWSSWNGIGLYRSRGALPFVDSTGATVIAVAASLAAIAAVVLGVGAAAFAHSVSHRIVLCGFLVVVLVLPLLTYRTVQNYRAGVWHPELTAAATAPAAVPDAIGPVRYRIPLGANEYSTDIYAAGNGFLVDTRRGLTAYEGPTGAKRWHVNDYGTSGRLLVVRRDRDDTAGIVVLFLYYGLIALDGSSGEVLWRRQYNDGGEVTAATGSVDALGMAVFTADSAGEGPDRSRTRFYSFDPATGQLRWSRPISCSNPTLTPGTAGQFGFDCGKPSIMDAHSGDTIDVPGEYTPRAGTDAYVIATPLPHSDPAPTDVTRVMDPAGKVIDEVPGTYPASEPHDGVLLVYGGGDTWVLRDYRNHRSTPVPIRIPAGSALADVETIWLKNRLVVTNPYDPQHRFELVDLTRPTAEPTTAESPCPRGQSPRGVQAVAGAIVVQCRSADVVGLVPEDP